MPPRALGRAALFVLLWATLFLFFPLPPTLSGLELLWTLSHRSDAATSWDYVDVALALCVAITAVPASLRLRRSSFNLASLLLLASTLSIVLFSFPGAFSETHQREPLLALALWSFFFAATLLQTDDRRVLLIAWVCILGMQMLVALAAYFISYEQFVTPGFGQRASGLFSNPNALYPWSLLSFFLFLELARSLSANKARLLVSLGAAGSLAVLVLTFSRAGWLGCAAGLLLAAAAHPFKHKVGTASRAFCLTLALCLVLGAAIVRTQGAVVSLVNDGSVAGRLVIWRGASQLWREHPWFGNGYDAFRLPTAIGSVSGEPKNLFLHVALQSGLVGLALYGLYFGSVLSLSRQMAVSDEAFWSDRVIARVTFFSAAALLVTGLFDTPVFGPLYRVPATITLLIFSGMLPAIADKPVPPSAESLV